ncbi:MAG: DUF488 family protein [Actinomycetota bacterium]|nr:MAG: DUF488 family protein [Actinomycetota bacterium]
MSSTEIVRVYEDQGREPGDYRVLVDRLWPRGVRKEDIDFDLWAKGVAPSSELRKWYSHDVSRFEEFVRRYVSELNNPEKEIQIIELRRHAGPGRLVLLTATRDVEHSAAKILHSIIEATS